MKSFLDNFKQGWKTLFISENIDKEVESILANIDSWENIFPERKNVFRIFEEIEPEQVKVVIIGQDPYHTPNMADGLAFSVSSNNKTPASLRNIFKELERDLGIKHYENTNLMGWLKQGVLLINSSLTVEKAKPGSHSKLGWERVVEKALNNLNLVNKNIIYCLWGNHAKNLYNKLNVKGKDVIFSSHPSPFSYKKGFENSKPFSKINEKLVENNSKPINWDL
ncbi:uracil-DNA glycosylase [Spiroplasma chinense]|uniref:Uracil-DNA glycosylase n=1 Tax=Spiroplasma chinense TaxID=216932 RepID=A0A5B9Y2D6_9MOLU|nr:uracil-DNA glycosylase [Spiroplasma chinense]QEH61228.1 uracil-DNA glycosylase [Spiroplasma chinense]